MLLRTDAEHVLEHQGAEVERPWVGEQIHRGDDFLDEELRELGARWREVEM